MKRYDDCGKMADISDWSSTTDFFEVSFFGFESFTDLSFFSPFAADLSACSLPLLLLLDFSDLSSPPFFLLF